ncbi:tail fiber protein [Pseudomonas chlororaphis]|uniref:phage tail protein n=1 Tax=Pseudomonas chlororaphis TaxID=587753 RepID=UPI00209BA635|nr:phage tail protein [Pseudomonas chlororaphis]MCO7569921.1 tail fiber protein [Pseudomonas chlororaphis]MCO7587818.1 tail fiber protein [Pseudomonas chlororaphis]
MDYPKSVPSVGLVNGKFVDENPVTGQVGSLISSQWGNAVTDELLNVIRAGGKVPAEAEHDQLLAAIKAIVRDSIPPEKIRTTLAEYGITDAYTKSVTYTKAEIEALLKNMSALPVGAMVPFPKGTVPPGFLEVDGSVQSAATYPDLAAYLGTTFNTGGEGAGNFRLPESRGEFLRGWDHGRGVDGGRSPGSWQADAFQGHYHASAADTARPYSTGGTVGDYLARFGTGNPTTNGVRDAINNGVDGTPRTASETRPRNLAVMWCIKAWNAPINQGNIDVAALAAEVQKLKALSGSSYQGLYVSASGTNALISVKARSLIVGKGSAAQALNAVDLSINLQTIGLNGLDSGVLAASSWYSAWVVSNGTQVAGIAALMPAVQCSTIVGSAVVTGIASTSSMRVGMPFGGASFPPGTFIKSVDSSSQITASVPALITAVDTTLRFVFEPIIPAGFIATRVSAFFTDTTANRYPLSYVQAGRSSRYKVASGSNLASLPMMASGAMGTATALVAVSIFQFVPPTATGICLQLLGATNSNSSAAPNASYIGGYIGPNSPPLNSTGSTNTQHNTQGRFVLEEPRVYYWGAGAAGLMCYGWEDDV